MKNPYFISFVVHFLLILSLALWPAPKKPIIPPSQTIQIRFRAAAQAALPEAKAETQIPQPKKIEKPVPPGPKLVEKLKPPKKETPKKEPPKAVQKEQPKTQAAPAPANTPFGETVLENANFPYSYYIEQMLNKIDQAWENPVRSDLPLSTVIYFRIQKDGSVTDLQVEAPSGFGSFDNACRRAILSADPFPPLPSDFADLYLGIHLEFKQ